MKSDQQVIKTNQLFLNPEEGSRSALKQMNYYNMEEETSDYMKVGINVGNNSYQKWKGLWKKTHLIGHTEN